MTEHGSAASPGVAAVPVPVRATWASEAETAQKDSAVFHGGQLSRLRLNAVQGVGEVPRSGPFEL